MPAQMAAKVADFIEAITQETAQERVSITFHGGEPLLAPYHLWEELLDNLQLRLKGRKTRLNLQSNLWALDDQFAALFKRHNVSIGTSLDGPEEICDKTRGKGYWARTMKGILKAREYGHNVDGIATITRETAGKIMEIADFYLNNQLSMVLHAAIDGFDRKASTFALSSAQYSSSLRALFPWYLKNRKNISVSTIDYFCRAFVNNDPEVCTFKDCLGMFLAIGPTGEIYHCQRFCGKEEFSLGNVSNRPSLSDIYNHSNAQKILHRQEMVAERCKECPYYQVCKGGCYYNALASGDGVIDHLCDAYKQTFAYVQERLIEEMSMPENIDAIAARPPREGEHLLLRKGQHISLAAKRHPSRVANTARSILAIHELAKTGDPDLSAQNLFEQRICGEQSLTRELLRQISQNLYQHQPCLNNIYVHITSWCNLHCSHCYTPSNGSRAEIDVATIERLLQEAANCGFRQFIVTGGEPLTYSQLEQLLVIFASNRNRGMNIVLRTNLTIDISDALLRSIALAFDQVVPSVDGNEQTHNQRRGEGTYRRLVENMERYQRIAASQSGSGELSVACVMRSDDINGEPGQSVRELAERLEVRRIRFRPLLPLGRAAQWDEPLMCEGLLQHISPDEMLESDFQPLTSCGLGQNLHVESDGNAFPCYALLQPHTLIGNVNTHELKALLASEAFMCLARSTVDTISKCKECQYRYLCGGSCRAWGNEETQRDINAAPPRCTHLMQRAENLVNEARKFLLS
ncbi:MAG: radical SAM protein [Nitrospirae bacterium]|nr:radical SAM protein [Nitrospirota bacterium]